ncbi:universal stress protein, UspA family [Formosa agariphila KMM 3901]|uniref:Universal stress protein, UspA family n=2 Tax=Formosa TaxID=225842 RepID=T2KLA5_FORAG|nr:universal stress protein, UspA family [Formosa agariphila KMM 3901]
MAKESIYKAQNEKSKNGLKDVLDKVNATYSNENHKYKCLSIFKGFSSAVKKVVEDFKIDCIVMGTKGAGAIKEITVGSNTSGLIGVVNCPIIAIPKYAEFKNFKEIGISTDFDISFTEKGLSPLLDIATSQKATVSICHVMDRAKKLTSSQNEKKEALKVMLKDCSAGYFTLTGIGVSTGIRAFVQSRKLDMLCVIAKEQDFLKRLLNQSYSKSITHRANVPLLILNIKNF